ncbi:MAG: DUF6800 family protein [Terriglobales bacterium]
MSGPSRRPEIRRRRARKESIVKLRRRYAKASSEAERNRILDKVKRVSRGLKVDEFIQHATAKKA